MSTNSEAPAREYLQQFAARLGRPVAVSDEEVRRLADLLERAVAEERQACAEVAEDVMRLCGSQTAEQIALLIRVREGGS